MTPSTVLAKVLPDSAQSLGDSPFEFEDLLKQLTQTREIASLTVPYGFAHTVVSILDAPPRSIESIREEFEELARDWEYESAPMSSAEDMAALPTYQRIISMGNVAVPWILERLKASPDYWFWALRCMTGEDPVPPGHTGSASLMAADWLEWGCSRGLVD